MTPRRIALLLFFLATAARADEPPAASPENPAKPAESSEGEHGEPPAAPPEKREKSAKSAALTGALGAWLERRDARTLRRTLLNIAVLLDE